MAAIYSKRHPTIIATKPSQPSSEHKCYQGITSCTKPSSMYWMPESYFRASHYFVHTHEVVTAPPWNCQRSGNKLNFCVLGAGVKGGISCSCSVDPAAFARETNNISAFVLSLQE